MELSRSDWFLEEIVKDVFGVVVINCDNVDASFRYSRDIPQVIYHIILTNFLNQLSKIICRE